MRDKKVFIDTNVLLYRAHRGDERKKRKADQLVNDNFQNAVLSVQVLREFFNGAVKKLGIPTQIACSLVENYARMSLVNEDAELVLRAIEIHQQRNFSFYDSLIVAAALRAKCKILYTEDLQHGETMHGLKIVNPFR